MNIRILHPGVRPIKKGAPKVIKCKILVFMWSFAPFNIAIVLLMIQILHDPIYTPLYYTTRIPMILVYEVTQDFYHQQYHTVPKTAKESFPKIRGFHIDPKS